MSHHQAISTGGLGCCVGGRVTHMQEHTHGGMPAVMLLICVLLLWRRVEDNTGMPLEHAVPSLMHAHTHIMKAEREASLKH